MPFFWTHFSIIFFACVIEIYCILGWSEDNVYDALFDNLDYFIERRKFYLVLNVWYFVMSTFSFIVIMFGDSVLPMSLWYLFFHWITFSVFYIVFILFVAKFPEKIDTGRIYDYVSTY